jgi:hypothetical protein
VSRGDFSTVRPASHDAPASWHGGGRRIVALNSGDWRHQQQLEMATANYAQARSALGLRD